MLGISSHPTKDKWVYKSGNHFFSFKKIKEILGHVYDSVQI